MQAHKNTALIRSIEAREGKPLIDILQSGYNAEGLVPLATRLGVSRSTVWYWLLRCRLELHKVALRPGERLEIIKAVPTPRAVVAPAPRAQ